MIRVFFIFQLKLSGNKLEKVMLNVRNCIDSKT